jgi:hypothetical protein
MPNLLTIAIFIRIAIAMSKQHTTRTISKFSVF